MRLQIRTRSDVAGEQRKTIVQPCSDRTRDELFFGLGSSDVTDVAGVRAATDDDDGARAGAMIRLWLLRNRGEKTETESVPGVSGARWRCGDGMGWCSLFPVRVILGCGLRRRLFCVVRVLVGWSVFRVGFF